MNGKTLVTVLTFNEGEKLKRLIADFPSDRSYDLLVVDDGSSDGTVDYLRTASLRYLRHTANLGVGASIKTAVQYARDNGYDLIVIMAGNGKMLPVETPRLLEPLLTDRADYVQGSRYLEGGTSPNLPLSRNIGIRLFTVLANLILGQKGTDITCGFRAYRLSLFDNRDIDIEQEWLSRYELEYYFHYKVIKAGYRIVEVPVSMVYPEDGKNYSKIKPFVGWWSMLRPWIFLTLRIKH